jgi:hypothetical protein
MSMLNMMLEPNSIAKSLRIFIIHYHPSTHIVMNRIRVIYARDSFKKGVLYLSIYAIFRTTY